MTHEAPDLGFFASTSPPQTPFGTPGHTAVETPFGTPAPVTAPPVGVPPATPMPRRTVYLVVLGVVVVLAVAGALTARGWSSFNANAAKDRTTLSTPVRIGDLARTSATAATLTGLQPDLAAAVRLRPASLATYSSGSVGVEVFAAKPVRQLDGAAQAKVLDAFSSGVERLTQLPPELAPVGSSLFGTFACSQVEIADTVPVACIATSSGAVVVILVSGQDYTAAGDTAARVRAAVEHHG
jgi:hypothetical protein